VIQHLPKTLGNILPQTHLAKILKFTMISVRRNRSMQLVMFNLKMEI